MISYTIELCRYFPLSVPHRTVGATASFVTHTKLHVTNSMTMQACIVVLTSSVWGLWLEQGGPGVARLDWKTAPLH